MFKARADFFYSGVLGEMLAVVQSKQECIDRQLAETMIDADPSNIDEIVIRVIFPIVTNSLLNYRIYTNHYSTKMLGIKEC